MGEIKLANIIASALGSIMMSLASGLVLLWDEIPNNRKVWIRWATEGVTALIMGIVAGHYLAPDAATWKLFGLQLNEVAASFIIGAAAFRVLPALVETAAKMVRNKAAAQETIQTTADDDNDDEGSEADARKGVNASEKSKDLTDPSRVGE